MSPFGMFGGAEFIAIAMFYMGIGLPLGVPPAEEDPLMSRVAPAECLYYVTWAGMAKPDGNSSNRSEKLLAEPEVQHFVKELEKRFDEGFARMKAGARSPDQALAAEVLPKLGKLLLTRSTAIFLSKLELKENGPPDMTGGLVVDTGDETLAVRDAILKLHAVLPEDAVSEVDVAGTKCFRVQLPEGAPAITWCTKGHYVLVGVGKGGLEQIFADARTAPPAWLTKVREQLPVERVSTLTYANAKAALAMGLKAASKENPDAPQIVAALGLNNLDTYAAVTGLDKSGFTSRTLVSLAGEPRGLMKLLDSKPLTAADLAPIPRDASLATTLRLDADKVLSTVLSVAREIDPTVADEMEKNIGGVSKMIGVDIQEEVLKSLGDTWCVYNSPGEGGLLLTGLTATVDIRDREKFGGAFNQLMAIAKASLKEPDEADEFGLEEWEIPSRPKIKEIKSGERTIYYVTGIATGMPFAPAWCLTDSHLVVSLFPQNIQAMLARGSDYQSLADVPEVKQLLAGENAPTMINYVDSKRMLEMFYPMLQMGAQAGFGVLERQGIDVDISILPSVAAIGRHMRPTVSAMRSSASGVEFVSKQSLPGANTGTTTPVMVALLLPAINAAREAARRNGSINNLRQIGLALLNHESATRRFPPQAIMTKDGKPGLSWRVKILPYIEEAALYEEFKLDEPWDSEHNKKLIERMPVVYQAPGSSAEPGKTRYLAVVGEDTIIAKEGKGTTIAEVRDGTSNTILAVEANDDSAVIWTKPDDLNLDAMKPLAGLTGVRSGGVFPALFCDCHVQTISETIDPKVLLKLFTKSGREVVSPRDIDGRAPRADDFGEDAETIPERRSFPEEGAAAEPLEEEAIEVPVP